MGKIKDISGQQFGRLTVIQHVRGNGVSRWKCQCTCGNITYVFQGNLHSGSTKSCGCLRKETPPPINFKHGMSRTKEYTRRALERSRKNNPERSLYNKAKERCKKSGVVFDISVKDIKIPSYCPLLGMPLNPWGPTDFCPSLDRKDNSKGYTPENIWVISFLANRMKNTATLDQWDTFCSNWLNKDIH